MRIRVNLDRRPASGARLTLLQRERPTVSPNGAASSSPGLPAPSGLPWVSPFDLVPTPTGLCQCGQREGRIPAGVGKGIAAGSQGSSSLATLGWRPQPRWSWCARPGSSRKVRRAAPHSSAAFTLIEVALSVAIVAFALVAIIGVMPAGLNVQRENREDAIINNDARFLIDAIRSGTINAALLGNRVDWVVVTVNGVATTTNYPPFAGGPGDVISLLSTPGSNVLNVARIRGLNGALGDTAGTAPDLMFGYIVTTQIQPHNPNTTLIAQYQTTNLYDLRMAFQWPVYANGTIGNGRQSYRAMIGGQLVSNAIGYTFNPTYYQSP